MITETQACRLLAKHEHARRRDPLTEYNHYSHDILERFHLKTGRFPKGNGLSAAAHRPVTPERMME
jgi:hypothetical protein